MRQRVEDRLVAALCLSSCIGALACVPSGEPAQPSQVATGEGAVEDRVFDSSGVRIHYTVQGRGDPVVLVHGFAMNQSRFRSAGVIEPLVDAGHRVFAIDCRGHGQSEGPHDPSDYGIEMARDVVRLLDHEGIDRAHVVGYSMGALVTNKVRQIAPERLRSATLGGSGWLKRGDPALADLSGDDIAESLEKTGDFKWMLRKFTENREPPANEDEIAARNRRMLEGNDALALAATLRAWDELAIPERDLRENTVPTLALIGENDPLRPGVDAMAAVMNNLEVVVIDDATHNALTSPEFVENVSRFLSENR